MGLAATAALASPAVAGAQAGCVAPGSPLRLDHVPIAVASLDDATRQLAEFGFRFKPGRAHPNGLENRHVKLADGSGLELVTVHEAGDPLAEHYARLIADGGGGAFIALSGLPVDSILARAAPSEPAISATRSAAFDWAAFPRDHPLGAVFFVDVRERAPDLPEHVAHDNGARALREAWVAVEDPARLIRLLVRFGARDCGAASHPFHLTGRAVGLAGGTLYVADAATWEADPGSAPVLSITLAAARDAPAGSMVLRNAGGLWLEIRPDPESRGPERARGPL